ncbi:hypothetical protein MJ561_06260 [Klebsiella pneumoniae]|nr:hypothetical protein MJ561_06260 [Klebsiella pneumoniae]
MIMRMLAEMAVAAGYWPLPPTPIKPSGRWAGTIGRLYWWFWVLVIPLGSQYRGDYSAFVGAGRPGVVVLLVITRPHRQ